MSVPVVLITLSGRARNGKDTFADIGLREYGATAKLALADWLKESSARVLGISLDRFYQGKDTPFDKPMVLTPERLRRLVGELKQAGYAKATTMGTSKWDGRQFATARDFLVWYSEKVVKPLLGETTYCRQLERRLAERIAADSKSTSASQGVLVYFITDCRFQFEIEYFQKAFPGKTYPVRIVRPDQPRLDLISENSIDDIDESLFFALIVNDGSLDDFNRSVLDVFKRVRAQVVAESTVVPSAAQQVAGSNRLVQIKKRFPHLGDNPTAAQIREAVMSAEKAAQNEANVTRVGIVESHANPDLVVSGLGPSDKSSISFVMTETTIPVPDPLNEAQYPRPTVLLTPCEPIGSSDGPLVVTETPAFPTSLEEVSVPKAEPQQAPEEKPAKRTRRRKLNDSVAPDLTSGQ